MNEQHNKNADDVTLRPATVEDAPNLAALAAVIWPEAFSDMITRAQIEYMLKHLQSAQAMATQMREGFFYWFICRGDQRIGYAAVRYDVDENIGHLSKLYILAAERGGGASLHALNALCDDARARGATRLSLTVNKTNARAIRFYEKHGFKKTRALVIDIGGGFVMDDFVMERPLTLESSL